MIPLLIPVVVASLAGLAFAKSKTSQTQGVNTPTRQLIFQQALDTVKDPDELRKLAAVYKSEGLTAQADLLNKRAALRELPPDVKAARRAAFKAGMNSNDINAITKLADAFNQTGATGAANALRKYADGLVSGTSVPAKPAANPTINIPVPKPPVLDPNSNVPIPQTPPNLPPDAMNISSATGGIEIGPDGLPVIPGLQPTLVNQGS